MSRLDDELKVAFRRQEPSPDFAARVLARINEAPAPQARPGVWQRFAAIFAVPAWRYAAVGAVALLLVLIGVALLREHRTATGGNELLAVSPNESPRTEPNVNDKANDKINEVNAPPSKDGLNAPRAARSVRVVHHHAPVIAQQARPSAEAEAAKEKVLSALQITSETLNDVQRAISDDHPSAENPEPVHNR